MTPWYIDPDITDGQEQDDYLGEYGVGKLRNAWADITQSADGGYFQKAGSTFAGKVSITVGGGSPSAPVLVGMYGSGAKPKINGAGNDRCMTIAFGQNNVVVQDYEMFGSDTGSAIRCFTAGSNASNVSNFVTLRGCIIHDPVSNGSQDCNGASWFGSDGLIENCEFYNIPTDAIWMQGARHKVRFNRMRSVGLDGRGAGDCVQIFGDSTLDTGGCEITHNYMDHRNGAFKQCVIYQSINAGSGGIIAHNVCLMADYDGTTSTAIFAAVNGCIVTGNRASGGNYAVYLDANNISVIGNVLGGVGTLRGLQQGSTRTGGKVVHNTVMDCSSYGIYADDDATAVIKNNILLRNAIGVGKEGTNANEDYNCYFGNGTDQINLGGTPSWGSHKFTVDPNLDARYAPQDAEVQVGGVYLGGELRDFYGHDYSDPPSIGAVQWPWRRKYDRLHRVGG